MLYTYPGRFYWLEFDLRIKLSEAEDNNEKKLVRIVSIQPMTSMDTLLLTMNWKMSEVVCVDTVECVLLNESVDAI